MSDFNHGVRTVEDQAPQVAVVDATMTNIAIIGTAPNAFNSIWDADEPISLFSYETDKIKALGEGGTLRDQIDAVTDQGIDAHFTIVRVQEAGTAEQTLTNVMGSAADKTGLHALKYAQAQAGTHPRLVMAPGFTSVRPDNAANPVVAEALGIMDGLEAIFLADGPDVDAQAAIQYREDFDSQRLYITDPHVIVRDPVTNQNIVQPVSGRVAGCIVKRDKLRGGPFHSPSNQPIQGIVGVSRKVEYMVGKTDHEANFLNANQIATIIPYEGFTLWGNELATNDPTYRFINVRRGRDVINDGLRRILMQYIGKRNMSGHSLTAMKSSLNSYMSNHKANENIIDFKIDVEEDKNNPSQLKQGKLRLEMYAEEPAPIQDITIGSHRYPLAYESLLNDIMNQSGSI